MKLQFLGATAGVTGSMYLLSIAGRNILVECGLKQGSPEEERRNADPFPFDLDTIDAVVLTHAHLDHSGRLPLLVRQGYHGPVYTHEASRDLCEILLQDAAYINEKETQWQNRKRERKGLPPLQPLYIRDDATAALEQFKPLRYHQALEILPGCTLELFDAGHILGSAIVRFTLHEDGVTRTLVFSGDLGHSGAPILRDPERPPDADLVVMESTYGDRLHRDWEQTWAEMNALFQDPDIRSGNILIPSFAVGRAQEMLYGFARFYQEWHLDQWSVFLDSPLGIRATDIYRRHVHLYDRESRDISNNNGNELLDLPNLHYSLSSEDSMAINRIHSGAIIIAGSGMCDGGRIRHHLKHNVWRRDCHVLIVGFQARGTLGRRLVDGAAHIRLWGETLKVNATVHTIGGFSAHADQRGLTEWYQGFSHRPQVILVHGEQSAQEVLATKFEQELQAPVQIARYQQLIDLKSLDPGRSKR